MRFLKFYQKHSGAALIISLVFVMLFSAMAVSMATISGSNLQIANNQQKANRALQAAESGFDIIRFWLDRAAIPGTTSPSDRFALLAQALQNDTTNNGASILTPSYSGSTMTISTVSLNSSQSQSFSIEIQSITNDLMQIEVTGRCGSITRVIRVNYAYGYRANNVFDYGVATRGALNLSGNILLEGANISLASDVYIESANQDLALSITGNSQIAGDVTIANPDAYVDLQGGQAGIGGETGQDAIDNHVTTGADEVEFPAPNPAHFLQYVQNTYDPAETTFENIVIPAGTNPSFGGGVVLNGIIYIETPNVVTFTGNATITGLIVGDGNINDNSGTNQIIFDGTVDSNPVTDLPAGQSQFDGLRDETGTFLMAPGFSTSFSGNFATLNGAIAANGIAFSGTAGGTINGSLLNYSDTAMTFGGTANLLFNRSGLTEIPAGFEPELVLYYDSDSYSEPVP